MDTIETTELIDLMKKNHQTVEANYAKLAKTVEDVPGMKAQLSHIEQKLARRQTGGPLLGENMSTGQTIVDSQEFKSFVEGGKRGMARLEIKTVGTIGSGSTYAGPLIAPQIVTDPIALPRRILTIRGLLAQGTTESNAIWLPRMTQRQLNAAPVAESAQKPKSDASFAQLQFPVVTIAHLMQVSRQAMDDAQALRSLIDAEMEYGLRLTEENQLLAGDGTGSNLTGLIPSATAYSGAFAVTGETAIDRIALAILQSELSLLPASGVIMSPTDWRKMTMQKDAQGRYILGNPNSNTAPTLWGLPVCATVAMPAGQFMVGAFSSAAQIFDRMGVEILISSENSNNFEINQLTVRCEERLALVIKQPLALIYGSMP